MKNTLFSLFFCLISLALVSQKETRKLDNYSSIKVSGGITVELLSGAPSAEINVTKGSLEQLITEVKNGTLTIKFGKKSWSWNNGSQKAEIKLYGAENLEGLDVSAGAHVYSDLKIESARFDLEVSSGGDAELELESGNAEVSVSSGGNAELVGEAGKLSVKASSGGKFTGHQFSAKEVKASASSGGLAKVWVRDHLVASAGSGGSVKYKGNPEHTDINVGKYSGGNVSRI